MVRDDHSPDVVRHSSLAEYFQHEVRAAVSATSTEAHTETVRYLANLLARFTRAERLFERTPDGVYLKPLAECYAEAARSESTAERYRALRRLGDVALFVAGVLPDSLQRKPVDVDYYVQMGGGAYACLADAHASALAEEVPRETFQELARKFTAFADVLAAVSDTGNDRDLLRTYEIWLGTGSQRAARRLRRAGIVPLARSARAAALVADEAAIG